MACKRDSMTHEGAFEGLLGEFRGEVGGLRGLARRWRGVLFGGWGQGARAQEGGGGVGLGGDWEVFVRVREACWEELVGLGGGVQPGIS